MWSIARGTVPLALFGADRYLVVMGSLAAPNLIVQALAPFVAGISLTLFGASSTSSLLAAMAATNVIFSACLARGSERSR